MSVIPSPWTAADAVALQTAMRVSTPEFAELIGVNIRTASRWRERPTAVLRIRTQQCLDIALDRASPTVQNRFAQLVELPAYALETHPQPVSDIATSNRPAEDEGQHLRADAELDGAWTSEANLRALRAVADAETMKRRMFLTLTGAAITDPAHRWLITAQYTDLAHGSGARVDMNTVEEIDAITAALRRMDDQDGSASLLPMVHANLRHVVGLLDHRSYTDTVARRLYSSGGELLRLAGWLAFDTGQHGHAQRFWLAALRAATTSGDRALAANTLGFMSCQAKDLGANREATVLADTARAGYRGASPRVSAILHLRAAEAHAAAGSPREANHAIDAAFHAIDSPTMSGPDWAYWLDSTQTHAQVGYAFLRMGQLRSARQHLSTALTHGPTDTRESALRYTLLATTYLHRRDTDLEHAVELAGRAADILTTNVTSTRCISHLTDIIDRLAPHQRQPMVKDLTDRVQTARAMTAARTR